jgi:hypothetical protein
MVRLPKLTSVAALAAVAVLAACDRDGVTHYRVAKVAPPTPPGASGGALSASAAMQGEVPPPTPPAGAPLRWTLPKGWTEASGSAMRFATFTPPVKGNVDASVVVLPGPAGGELPNVNRWRGQIGLPPLDERALAAARKTLSTKAGTVRVYDFTNEGTPRSRLVAALAESAGNTWFVKMTGDADAVGAAREDFMTLLGSLRFDESR